MLYNTQALPVLLYSSETWTIKARDVRRIKAAEMKYMRRTAGYTWDRLQNKFTHCKGIRNNTGSRQTAGIQEELDTTCKQNASWQTAQDNETLFPNWQKESWHPLKRLLDTWDRNGSTSGLTPWQTYDDDSDYAKHIGSNCHQSGSFWHAHSLANWTLGWMKHKWTNYNYKNKSVFYRI